MPVLNLEAVPVEIADQHAPEGGQAKPVDPGAANLEAQIISYVINWRNQLRTARADKRNIWDECWQLYRGLEDFSSKEDWQSKIVLPKSWSSVKQATNVIKRLLSTSKNPWNIEAVNPDDLVVSIRAEQMTDLTKAFMEKAHYQEEFAEGLECGFIIGLGLWKVWWGLVPRTRVRVQTVQVPMAQAAPAVPGAPSAQAPGDPMAMSQPGATPDLLTGEPPARGETGVTGQAGPEYPAQDNQLYPTQLPGEALDPRGWSGEMGASTGPQQYMANQRQIIREQVLEGRLFVRAVDPYNFYWLPGSKLNRWAGTIEEIEIPRWQLLELADMGILDKAKIDRIQPMKIDESQKQSALRFSERAQTQRGNNLDTGVVKVTEYYGPLIIEGKIVEKHAHVLIANDHVCLIEGAYQKNQFWHQKAPYIGFSPLSLPFRTEGVGLVEMVRKIDKGLSQLTNLGMDTLMFRLLPVFEVNFEAFDNPEDFETGLTPGKLFKRNATYMGGEGIKPIEFQDISSGTVQVAANLDREHQAGSLVSEIQQAIPRYRGAQSATEVQEKSENQDSFFGCMATDIEKQALEPMVEMAVDLLMQFISTADDPRVESILGLGAGTLRGLSREELMEMIQGDYAIKVTGISGQLAKAEMLQSLVQFMNLIGQNPEAWLPYINQDILLHRILESFRPAIHDIEQIIADPETAQANKAAASSEQITPEVLRQMVEMTKMAQDQQQQQQAAAQQAQQQQMQQEMQQAQLGLEVARMHHEQTMAEREHEQAMAIAKQTKTAKPAAKPAAKKAA